MFSEYRNCNRKTSDHSDNEHENAFIKFSNTIFSRNGRERSRMKKKHYVGTFDDILLSIKLESLYLEETTPPMKRYSSPTRDHCFHCAHDHNQSCCLYYYDTDSDKMLYSKWKNELEAEKTYYVRNTVPKIPEALAGNTTPRHFPGFTYNNPEFIETRIGHYSNQNVKQNLGAGGGKTRWFRQFYYPLFAMDIIPTISGIPINHASVLPPPPEIRPLSSLPPPPVPIPSSPQPPTCQPEVPKMCCNAHILVKQHKTTKDQHNHYYNNNRYYHYHHHHYNNYNNNDKQQPKKFIPTKYFYNQQTSAYQSNKRKTNYQPTNHVEHLPQYRHNNNHNKQNKNNRYNKNKQNHNDYQRYNGEEWNRQIGRISTDMIHEIPYMYFY